MTGTVMRSHESKKTEFSELGLQVPQQDDLGAATSISQKNKYQSTLIGTALRPQGRDKIVNVNQSTDKSADNVKSRNEQQSNETAQAAQQPTAIHATMHSMTDLAADNVYDSVAASISTPLVVVSSRDSHKDNAAYNHRQAHGAAAGVDKTRVEPHQPLDQAQSTWNKVTYFSKVKIIGIGLVALGILLGGWLFYSSSTHKDNKMIDAGSLLSDADNMHIGNHGFKNAIVVTEEQKAVISSEANNDLVEAGMLNNPIHNELDKNIATKIPDEKVVLKKALRNNEKLKTPTVAASLKKTPTSSSTGSSSSMTDDSIRATIKRIRDCQDPCKKTLMIQMPGIVGSPINSDKRLVYSKALRTCSQQCFE